MLGFAPVDAIRTFIRNYFTKQQDAALPRAILQNIIETANFDNNDDLAVFSVDRESQEAFRRRYASDPLLWNTRFLTNPSTRYAEQVIQNLASSRVKLESIEDPAVSHAPYISLQYPQITDEHLPLIVKKFPKLAAVKISPPCKITSLRPLNKLENLKSLMVHPANCKAEELASFAHLESLTLIPCSQMEKSHDFMEGIKNMSHLRALNLGNSIHPLDLALIAQLKKLTQLNLYFEGCKLPEDAFAPLAGLKRLHTLTVTSPNGFESCHFKQICQFTGLKSLHLHTHTELEVSDIGNLNNLQTLVLRAAIDINDLMGRLGTLKKLQHLTVESHRPQPQLEPPRIQLPAIKYIALDSVFTSNAVRDWHSYELPRLENIGIRRCSDIEIPEKTIPKIKKIDCEKVPQLDLSQFENLESLDLGTVRSFERFEELKLLKRLKHLKFETYHLSQLDLSQLNQLPRLEELYIQCHRLGHSNISLQQGNWERMRLPNLKILSIDGEFQGLPIIKLHLQNFPKLEYLSWSRCLEEGFDWLEHVELDPSRPTKPAFGYRIHVKAFGADP